MDKNRVGLGSKKMVLEQGKVGLELDKSDEYRKRWD